MPSVKVTELFSVVKTMLDDASSAADPDISKLTFVSPAESASEAKKCKKEGGNVSSYQLGKRILIL